MSQKILIVEDELAIAEGLKDFLTMNGFEVEHELTGKKGLNSALEKTFDLILLDIMLPELDGYTVCNKIREKNKDIPIIMLTAKSNEDDIITGLTLGADDYVAKPFSINELLLRIKAVLKRSVNSTSSPIEHIAINPTLLIDTVNLVAKTKDDKIDFTRREVDILKYLKTNNIRPVSRGELLEKVWGYSSGLEIETRTVDIHIAKLRKKIESNVKDPVHLVTIRGEGYKLITN